MSPSRRYICTRCGACCRWPGIVRLKPGEPARIARFLGMSESRFLARYTVLAPDRRNLVLTDRADGACVFLEGANRCRIYPVRPEQCRGFPNAWRFPGFDEECRAIDADRLWQDRSGPAPR